MKNKTIFLYTLLLFLVPIATAVELSYDSEPYSNGMMVSKVYNYSVRVRFTPTSDVVGGTLQQVRIYWCNQCSNVSGMFSILVYDCNSTGGEGIKSEFNSSVLSMPGVFQTVDISSLGFPVGSGDFCVEVRSQDVNLFIFMGGNNSNLDRSYLYGYPSASWNSLDYIQAYIPSVRELAIRAVVSAPPVEECHWDGEVCSGSCGEGYSCGMAEEPDYMVEYVYCTCQLVTTTTSSTSSTSTTLSTTTTTLRRLTPQDGGGGGGDYGPNRTKTCYDGIKNCHHNSCELGVDCGGPCIDCPTCSDGIQNQGELGVDCGGPCLPCPVVTTIPTTTTVVETTTTTTTTTSTLPVQTTTTIKAPEVTGGVIAFSSGGVIIFSILFFFALILLVYFRRKGGLIK